MASGAQGPKQTKGYFVLLSSLAVANQLNIAAATGAGGSYQIGAITPASGGANLPLAAGALLKDMGKTVVSSTHSYRKVQLVSTPSAVNATTAKDGMPFYIELPSGSNMSQPNTQVAYLPGLM